MANIDGLSTVRIVLSSGALVEMCEKSELSPVGGPHFPQNGTIFLPTSYLLANVSSVIRRRHPAPLSSDLR
jgi:hypothetical protein